MSSVTQPSYTREQVAVWLRGLLTIAWADGHFDPEEQNLIAALTHNDLADVPSPEAAKLSPDELAAAFGQDATAAENFLRTAVMVAVADGIYSSPEDEVLHQFCLALGLELSVLDALRSTLYHPEATSLPSDGTTPASRSVSLQGDHHVDVLRPVRDWLDGLEMHDPSVAEFLCKMIPAQCPFERDIKLFGHKVVHIPPLCKLNPLYEQLVSLRFRALSYLADDCGKDVSEYC
jgi:tellurite resistance protein